MKDANDELTGIEKAAIFLLTIEKPVSAVILQHMNPRELQVVGQAMVSMAQVERNHVNMVFKEFFERISQNTGLGIGADEDIRDMLTGALGEEEAEGLLDQILVGGQTKGLDALKWMDARAVADVIRYEHPQIISVVLSYVESEQAAEILSYLPENQRCDLVMRVAALEGIQPHALRELNNILEDQFSGKDSVSSAVLGGVKVAAEIMNFVDTASEEEVMNEIRTSDEDLAEQIQDLMFVFADLMEIEDRAMQRLLTDVSSDKLMLALKGVDEAMVEKVCSNMSERAAQMLKEDLEVASPAKVSEVEGAQKEILAVARKLAENGEIILGAAGGGEDMI